MLLLSLMRREIAAPVKLIANGGVAQQPGASVFPISSTQGLGDCDPVRVGPCVC
ncbi:hypothetical protein QFZ94_007015 [Paraburkholderia sp. JPY465]